MITKLLTYHVNFSLVLLLRKGETTCAIYPVYAKLLLFIIMIILRKLDFMNYRIFHIIVSPTKKKNVYIMLWSLQSFIISQYCWELFLSSFDKERSYYLLSMRYIRHCFWKSYSANVNYHSTIESTKQSYQLDFHGILKFTADMHKLYLN